MPNIIEYINALKASESMGEQVVHHEVLPGRPANFADTARPLPASLSAMLTARGIGSLFSHQAEAADFARIGKNVVVATPTASGKTFTYNLPVFEQVMANPDTRALYLFPLKALAQDQLKTIEELAALLPGHYRPTAAIYDGDTTPYRRRKLRDEPPNILLTNPEMVHLSMLPYHESWAAFFAGLTHIVVDEVHTYRGVMGSHMAMVFRRLRRVCSYYGSDPAFVFCSATVGNPVELTEQLTNIPAEPILESGAPQGRRHFVFLNPVGGSPATAAIRLLQSALVRGLRTIVYTQSRKMTELISIWASENAGEFRDRISAYRAGFLPEERREIEAKMASGELLAVVSTSALELGIDIGSLDLCILVGYPGTVMQTLQRGGRVGRKQQESGVVLVAGEDALDQYFMRNPEDFFSRPPECAVLNPYNPVIMDRHLDCAAAELTLRKGEPFLQEPELMAGVERLVREGRLLEDARSDEIHSRRKRPHREVDLRGAGGTFTIEDAESGQVVGQVDEVRAYKETHAGAVYLHRGESYVVEELDIPGRKAVVRKKRVGYYTRVRAEKSTEILEVRGQAEVWNTRVFLGKLRVTERITGYEKRNTSGGRLLTIVPLELPELTFETEGIWIEFPKSAQQATEDARYHFMGGIHAVEHAAIGILPLLVMTDRNDLGGISIPFHPQVGCAAVFVYDGHPGGVGLSRLAFTKAGELLEKTLAVIRSCPCELGCPSCVHSPKCGSGNRPIAKDASIFVLERLKSCEPHQGEVVVVEQKQEISSVYNYNRKQPQSNEGPKRFGVLDIETRRSAQEVGGWHRADKMGVSVAVLYDSGKDEFLEYAEEQIPELVKRLSLLDLIIGFNIRRFDYKVLSGIVTYDYKQLPTLDLLDTVYTRLSYRLSLDHLAGVTLGAEKSADGLQALKWWQEGEVGKIAEYCRKDVEITRDLYLYGREHGFVLFRNKAGKEVKLPVDW